MTAALVAILAAYLVGVVIGLTGLLFVRRARRHAAAAAYQARLQERLARVVEDVEYARARAQAPRPFDRMRQDLGTAMLLATIGMPIEHIHDNGGAA